MLPQDAKDYYDRQYRSYGQRRGDCPNSLHDLDKARRRVRSVLRRFGISNCSAGARALDVGCGLGYYTKALADAGLDVTGIDISEAGIEVARSSFPGCDYRRAAWHDDIEPIPQFDLIWSVSLSLINTFDVNVIHEQYIVQALARLKPGGTIVLGWHTDFSGRRLGHWSHWSPAMLGRMRQLSGLSAPFVPEARSAWLSSLMVWAGRVMKKGVPIFMARRQSGTVAAKQG